MTYSKKNLAHFGMMTFSALVAGSFPIGARIAGNIDPIALTFARFCLATVLICIFLLLKKELKTKYFVKFWRYAIIGALFATYFICMFEALKTASPISTSTIFTLMPFMSVCLDRLFFGVQARKRMIFLLLTGALGALIIVFKGSWEQLIALNMSYGEMTFFSGTIAHAAFAILIPKFRRQEPAIFVSFASMLAASALILVVFPAEILTTDWLNLPKEVYFSIIYLGVFATIITFTLLTFASSQLHSGNMTAYTFMTPFWVTLIEFGIFGTALEFYFFQGGILLFIALFLLLRLSPNAMIGKDRQ
jgi:drug/metabolite transporter (DMT)-like permease